MLADIHHSKECLLRLTVLNADVLVLFDMNVLLQATSKISVQCCPLVVPGVSELSLTQIIREKNVLRQGSGKISEVGD